MYWAEHVAPNQHGLKLKSMADGYKLLLPKAVEQHGVVGDDALEGMMGLVCIGEEQSIPLWWIERVIKAQNPDGGWAWELTGPRTSNPHTAVLAVWVLAAIRASYAR